MANSSCLLCDQSFKDDRYFSDLIWPNFSSETLCRDCRQKIDFITGDVCEDCGRPSSQKVCQDCQNWRQKYAFLLNNQALVNYNPLMKDYMHYYKFVGDYRLRQAFSEDLKKKFKKIMTGFDLVIPIPISESSMAVRGFNQVTGLFEFAALKMSTDILAVKEKKQTSKLKRQARLKKENLFYLAHNDVAEKSILLLDDVYTTGTTLHQTADVLYMNKAKKVSSITLAR